MLNDLALRAVMKARCTDTQAAACPQVPGKPDGGGEATRLRRDKDGEDVDAAEDAMEFS